MRIKAINVLKADEADDEFNKNFTGEEPEHLAESWINGNKTHVRDVIKKSENPGWLAKQVRDVLLEVDEQEAVAFNNFIFRP